MVGHLRRKRLYKLFAAFLLITLILLERVSGQTPASCSSVDVGSGSGNNPQLICGDNSFCLNNAVCECENGYFSPSRTNQDCQSVNAADSRCSVNDCVYCGSNFMEECQKCVNVIYNGQCLSECPSGTRLSVYTLANISLAVRSCVGVGPAQVLQEWAVIVIIVLGVVVLVVVAILITAVACTCLRRSNVGQLDIAEREAKQQKITMLEDETDAVHENGKEIEAETVMEDHFEPGDYEYEVNEEEREEFFARLETLREQSETFLKMLNDMRRRLKELPANSPATQQYKNVMRDLTRLLYMLNKKQEKVRIPPDGIQLLTWSEQILNRYLTAQGKPPVSSSPIHSASPASSSPERFSTIGDTAETDF